MIGGVYIRLIETGVLYSGLYVVRNDNLWPPPKNSNARTGTDPGAKILPHARLGIAVVGSTQNSHENRRFCFLSCFRIRHRTLLSRIVDEKLLSGLVLLTHHHIQALCPLPVKMTELTVLISFRIFSYTLPKEAEVLLLYASALCERLLRGSAASQAEQASQKEDKAVTLKRHRPDLPEEASSDQPGLLAADNRSLCCAIR